jgi:hypothetical protein
VLVIVDHPGNTLLKKTANGDVDGDVNVDANGDVDMDANKELETPDDETEFKKVYVHFCDTACITITMRVYSGVYILDSLSSGHPDGITEGIVTFMKNRAESMPNCEFQTDNFQIHNPLVICFLLLIWLISAITVILGTPTAQHL